jgi:hypothetical protein
MAKAVIPMRAFRQKFGELSGDEIGAKLSQLVQEFLTHEQAREKEKPVPSAP